MDKDDVKAFISRIRVNHFAILGISLILLSTYSTKREQEYQRAYEYLFQFRQFNPDSLLNTYRLPVLLLEPGPIPRQFVKAFSSQRTIKIVGKSTFENILYIEKSRSIELLFRLVDFERPDHIESLFSINITGLTINGDSTLTDTINGDLYLVKYIPRDTRHLLSRSFMEFPNWRKIEIDSIISNFSSPESLYTGQNNILFKDTTIRGLPYAVSLRLSPISYHHYDPFHYLGTVQASAFEHYWQEKQATDYTFSENAIILRSIYPEIKDLSITEALYYLDKKRKRTTDSVDLYGAKISLENLNTVGGLIIVILLSYNFMHLRALRRMLQKIDSISSIPWIGIYIDPFAQFGWLLLHLFPLMPIIIPIQQWNSIKDAWSQTSLIFLLATIVLVLSYRETYILKKWIKRGFISPKVGFR